MLDHFECHGIKIFNLFWINWMSIKRIEPSKKNFFWKNLLARLSKVFMADDILLLHFRKVFMADDILLLHFRKVLLVELLLLCSRHPNSHHNINRKLNHVLYIHVH